MLLSRNSLYFSFKVSQEKQQNNKHGKNVIFHDTYQINYTKLQLNDNYLSNLMLLVKSKKHRLQKDQVVVEGNQLIYEAVKSHFKLNYLLFNQFDKIEPVLDIMGRSTGSTEFVKVPQHDLKVFSCLTTCPGVIGIFDKPEVNQKENSLPITIICDNIREPNNLGSIIRVGNALPVEKILLPKGCTDPWDTKCIRGSSGSVFYTPVQTALKWIDIEESIKSVQGESIVLIADNNGSKYDLTNIINYDQIDARHLKNKHIYVIIGGETHGISEDAIRFASKGQWKVINIPLDSTTNSLNTSSAISVILFELRRQLKR